MKTKVNKIYHGKVSVRDYIVKKAMDKKEPLTIEHKGEKMTVAISQLGYGVKNFLHLKSKVDGSEYDLVDYPWKPDQHQSQTLI